MVKRCSMVERYSIVSSYNMGKREDGFWVEYQDYQRLEAELAECKAERDASRHIQTMEKKILIKEVEENAAISAELAECKAEANRYKDGVRCPHCDELRLELGALHARCERLEVALNRYVSKFGNCGEVYDEAKQALEVPK